MQSDSGWAEILLLSLTGYMACATKAQASSEAFEKLIYSS